MPAWFAFGDKPDSWVVANQTLLDYKNMPEGYEGKFKMYEWNANTVGWISTGGPGFYTVYLSADGYARYGPVDLIPLVKVDLLGRGRPMHVAFGPGGMWFARFKGVTSAIGTTLWGPATTEATPPVYSKNWINIIEELRAAENIPRDEHAIEFITFGCHDLLILRYENGNAQIYGPDDEEELAKCQPVIDLVREKLNDGWTVGNRTTLCQYDPTQYFIEWKKGGQANFAFSVGTEENKNRVLNVLNLVGNDAAAQAIAEQTSLVTTMGNYNASQIYARAFR